MTIQNILIGSIGVLAETSDIQRRAYNQAFREAGLDWQWDEETYKVLLRSSGGMKRLRRLSADQDQALSAEMVEKLHARKTEIACAEITDQGVDLRPGVMELMRFARDASIRLALVTTTYRQNINAIAIGARQGLRLEDFAQVLTVEDVRQSKPNPEVYKLALSRLGALPGNCLAIEDSVASLNAALGAGIQTLVTPGAFTSEQDFENADWHFASVLEFMQRSTVLQQQLV
ncbi:MAG: HAD-IA family hydrolase [Pseudomonadota bacterium]